MWTEQPLENNDKNEELSEQVKHAVDNNPYSNNMAQNTLSGEKKDTTNFHKTTYGIKLPSTVCEPHTMKQKSEIKLYAKNINSEKRSPVPLSIRHLDLASHYKHTSNHIFSRKYRRKPLQTFGHGDHDDIGRPCYNTDNAVLSPSKEMCDDSKFSPASSAWRIVKVKQKTLSEEGSSDMNIAEKHNRTLKLKDSICLKSGVETLSTCTISCNGEQVNLIKPNFTPDDHVLNKNAVTIVSDESLEKMSDSHLPLLSEECDFRKQPIVQKEQGCKFSKYQNKLGLNDFNISDKNVNLTDEEYHLPNIGNTEMSTENEKTEDSIQEWLNSISEWVGNHTWLQDHWPYQDDDNSSFKNETKTKSKNENESNKQQALFNKECGSYENSMKSSENQTENDNAEKQPSISQQYSLENDDRHSDNHPISASSLDDILTKASNESPANVPMVVMQCSRLHSHITNTPPFQQSSLPMGTLVTALYKENDWLYVRTPHGVEGFVSHSSCVPFGTLTNETVAPKHPWEPCEFPLSFTKYGESQHQYASFSSKTSFTRNVNGSRPCFSSVKVKNFYKEKCLRNDKPLKTSDSIKTAKSVTDILRNSPDTKISDQYSDCSIYDKMPREYDEEF